MRKWSKEIGLIKLMVFTAILATQSSCAWFRPATDGSQDKVYKDEDLGDIQGTKVYDPETGTYRTVHEINEKVDTVSWTNKPEDKFPPIKTDAPIGGNVNTNPGNPTNSGNTNTGGSGKGTGDISLLLPFLASSSTSEVPENSLWAVNYYAGARLAYDDLEAEGDNYTIHIMDTEASVSKANSLLKTNELQKSDLIIGPYKREVAEILEAYAKKNKVPLVVPYTAQMGMAENNPYYIQVNPSLKSHCEAITRHIRKSHDAENVVLVALDKPEEKARFKYFQDANALINKGKSAGKFQELLIPEGATNFQTINLSKYFKPGATTVFVVPSWSNQTFIYSLLRQLLNKQAEGEDVLVYAMSMWLEFEQIDFEYYEKLKLHVSSASYINHADERIKQFKEKYFQAYGTVPAEESYWGYDAMLYFGKMLAKYGKDFPKKLDVTPFDVLHGRFEFNRVVTDPSKHKEDLDYYDQLENTFVHILKFQDFHLQPAD